MLLEDYFHARRVRQKVVISLYTPEAGPLEVLGPQNSDELRSLLAHKGIEVQTGKCLAAVDSARHVATMSDGEEAPFQMLVTEPEFHLPPVLSDLGLADESGRIPADPATFETARENVFAIGDATYLTLLGGDQLPRAPGFAEQQAQTVAHNIAYRAGRGPSPRPLRREGALAHRDRQRRRHGRRGRLPGAAAPDHAQAAEHALAPRQPGPGEVLALALVLRVLAVSCYQPPPRTGW